MDTRQYSTRLMVLVSPCYTKQVVCGKSEGKIMNASKKWKNQAKKRDRRSERDVCGVIEPLNCSIEF